MRSFQNHSAKLSNGFYVHNSVKPQQSYATNALLSRKIPKLQSCCKISKNANSVFVLMMSHQKRIPDQSRIDEISKNIRHLDISLKSFKLKTVQKTEIRIHHEFEEEKVLFCIRMQS